MTTKKKANTTASSKINNQTNINLETHTVILEGKASKLSTKQNGFITFTLATNNENQSLELKLTGNDGGGLHSKEWLPISTILEVLDLQIPDKPFKSTVFKTVFQGASANNASFLAAVLRSKDINLIVSTEKSQYLHMIPKNYESVRDQLLALNKAN